MKTYCVKCREKSENLNSNIFKIKNDTLIMQSKCPECRFKKSQEVNELLGKLRIKTPLSKIPLLIFLF